MITRLAHHVIGMLLAGTLSMLTTSIDSPASPDTNVIELSLDNTTFTQSATDVFGRTILSPGSERTGRLWVRNAGTEAGYLAVTISNIDIPDPLVASATSISIGVEGIPERTQSLNTDESCLILTSSRKLQVHEVVKLIPRIALGDLNGTDGMNTPIRFQLRVLFSAKPFPPAGNECIVPQAPSPTPSNPQSPLAITGSAVAVTIIAAILVFIIGSVVAVSGHRRSVD